MGNHMGFLTLLSQLLHNRGGVMTFDGRTADHVMKFPRLSPSLFCILQVIKNWRRRRPGNEASEFPLNSILFPETTLGVIL